jgi:hypothetical protein
MRLIIICCIAPWPYILKHFKEQRLLHIPPTLTWKDHFAQRLYLWHHIVLKINSDYFLNRKNRLLFLLDNLNLFFQVGREFLKNIIYMDFWLQTLKCYDMTTESRKRGILEAAFSMRSVPRLYKKGQHWLLVGHYWTSKLNYTERIEDWVSRGTKPN